MRDSRILPVLAPADQCPTPAREGDEVVPDERDPAGETRALRPPGA